MMDPLKRCFVVMGFGIKTDFATGRKLDLNKTYRLLIKPVVEAKGLLCVRADEIPHSGSIDARMYQELFTADVVIADLSTANVNAFYELGIRHALRPRTTIVISEDKLTYPFDLNHVKITSYTHLGDAIDYEEVERFRIKLSETLEAVLADEQPDSPIYTYLQKLIPPSLQEQTDEAFQQIQTALDQASENDAATGGDNISNNSPEAETLALLTEQGEQALKNKDYSKAKAFFNVALLSSKKDSSNAGIANDAYLLHCLAQATYKAQEPDAISALEAAIRVLDELDLDHTNDPATVALAGAIEKQLYEQGQGDTHLACAVLYYERAYYLLHNRYHGINLAFLLNCRANSSLAQTSEERIADMVYANHARKKVLVLCDQDWLAITNRKNKAAKNAIALEAEELTTQGQATEDEQKFWITVNKAEAHFGLGHLEEYKQAREEAQLLSHAAWMMAAFDQQIQKLGEMLRQ